MGDWQPIETAPKDGTEILLCNVLWPHSRILVGKPVPRKIGAWHEGAWYIFGASWEPTHWLPLPETPPPAGKEE